jgi:hypothetical protein
MPEKATNGAAVGESGGHDSMTSIKDENAVNHEIATLLLNLASRTSGLAAGGADDKMTSAVSSNNKAAVDVAMDLSIYAKSNSLHAQKQQQQQTSALSNGGAGFQSAAVNGGGGAVPGTNPYSLFPLSSVPALPSSYLLQNLLIGE